MSDYRVKGTDLSSIADAIRTKGGTSASLSFPDGFVDAIEEIPSGGGSTLITKNITENGTYNASSDSADGYSSVTVAVPSKLIVGTFEGSSSEKGSAISVSIPYTGSGYPIAGVIYPTGGSFKSGSAIASLTQQSAVYFYAFSKNDVELAPTFADNVAANQSEILALYKYNTSESAAKSHQGQNFYNDSARATAPNCVRFRSKTEMSVYIADTSYGFPDGIEFTYQIIYSS